MRALVILLALATLAPQAPVERFKGIWYIAGHSDNRFAKNRPGDLFISDSTLLWVSRYRDTMVIPLAAVTELAGSVQSRGPTTGAKVLLGGFAGSSNDELVAVAFDTEQTAEAPVFKTGRGESTAVLAKIKYRLRKMGKLPPSTTVDTTGQGGIE